MSLWGRSWWSRRRGRVRPPPGIPLAGAPEPKVGVISCYRPILNGAQADSGHRRGPDTMEDMPHAEIPLKVLVVDDQADSADAVAFMLSLMGHDVHTAYGPREALELFRELQPSVVFMDISMPELSGLEAAARIRSLPEGTSTTIIALTGLGHEQDRRRSREASIDHHVVKPASPAVLHRLLSAIHPEPRTSGVGT